MPPGLADAWAKPLSEFATLPATEIEPGLRERHRIYSLLTMAVVASQFNGNKHGDRGDYGPWREGQVELEAGADRVYRGGTYLGHNIGAIAVDARGTIVDFDFNHNEVFNSSVEHAESRLVRRLFGLAQVFDPWRQAGVGVAPEVAAGVGAGAAPQVAPDVAGERPTHARGSARTFLFTADPVATLSAVGAAAPAQRGLRDPPRRRLDLHLARVLRAVLRDHGPGQRPRGRLPAIRPGPVPRREPDVPGHARRRPRQREARRRAAPDPGRSLRLRPGTTG